MFKWITVWIVAASAALAAEPVGITAFVKPAGSTEVELLADHTAVVPGGSVGLAIRFKIEREWHIYWRNRGEGGLETTFAWALPKGASIEPVLFPPPRRYVDKADAHTFVLEGEPVFLTTLKAPADAKPGQTLTIGLTAKWLVCREVCKLGNKTLSLTLPMVATAAEAQPANELLFKRARAELPLPPGKARNLKSLSAVASLDQVKPGGEFKVAVVADVAPDWHINAHKPLDEYSIPTDVFNDAVEALVFGRPVFPAPHVETGPDGEKVAIHRGRTVIVLPVTAEEGLSAKEVRISGVITYQACNDKTKQCEPPTSAEWAVAIPVASKDAVVKAVNAEVFATAGPPASGPSLRPSTRESGSTEANTAGNAATVRKPVGSGTWLGRFQEWLTSLGLMGTLVMAFGGGFILNLMPCVLPVISIKVLSFVQQAKENRVRVFTLGLAFSTGIMLSFVALGILIVMLGQQWGGLFQRPQVVIGLCSVVTAFSLSLFGVFSLFPPRIVNELGERVRQEGHAGALGMGLLATLLGTACTAPLLSAAIATASQQPPVTGLLIFLVAGAGMAFPYVLLAAQPAWLRIVPRPGPWMKTFEVLMGFALLATVVWLLSTVLEQLGGEGLLWTIVFLLCVALAAWVRGRVPFDAPATRKATCYGAMLAILVGGWLLSFHGSRSIASLIADQKRARLAMTPDWLKPPDWDSARFPWIEYTRSRATQAVSSGYTVFIDYTASWCANCKANEKAFIDTTEVREAMRRLGVLPFRADFSLPDPEIQADLDKYGRAGVPMYLVVPARRPEDTILLDELLTKGSIISALEKAGPSEWTRR